jgi:hypothetical protein
MGRGEMFTVFWLGGLKGKYHWEDLGVGVGERMTLRWNLDMDRWSELDSAGLG